MLSASKANHHARFTIRPRLAKAWAAQTHAVRGEPTIQQVNLAGQIRGSDNAASLAKRWAAHHHAA